MTSDMQGKAARKAESRRRILEKASRRIRSAGLEATGVRDVMNDADLTHGAFYAHFASRDDILLQAMAAAFDDSLAILKRASSDGPDNNRLEAIIAAYLRPVHVQQMGRGCAVAALAPEVARSGPETKAEFLAGIAKFVDYIERALPPGGSKEERETRALALFANMSGIIQVARTMTREAGDLLLTQGRIAVLASASLPWSPDGRAADADD